MDIRNCSRCRKIYRYDGFRICHSCRQEDEKDFQIVKDYLEEYPGANISSVVEGTGVDTKKVMEFLREGRLEIESGGDIVLDCEKCGAPITTGRYCKQCAGGLQRELGKIVRSSRKKSPPKSSDKEKFRVIDRYEDRR